MTDLDILISAYEQIPPTKEIARRACALMMTFAHSHGLHALDALIAATAIEHGPTVLSRCGCRIDPTGMPNEWHRTDIFSALADGRCETAAAPAAPATDRNFVLAPARLREHCIEFIRRVKADSPRFERGGHHITEKHIADALELLLASRQPNSS